MFTPMFHGQNRMSSLNPPIRDEYYLWINSDEDNLNTGDDWVRYTNIPFSPDSTGSQVPFGYYTDLLTTHNLYAEKPYLNYSDSSFGNKGSSLLSNSPSTIGTGLYKLNTIPVNITFPYIYTDATLFIVLEYYPELDMDDVVLWSWRTENDEDLDLFEYVMNYNGFSLRKIRKNFNWNTEYIAGSFDHKYDPALNINKVVLCLTGRTAWIDGVKAMDSSESAPLNDLEQMKIDQYTSLFCSIYQWDRDVARDNPPHNQFNYGKFSEAMFYTRTFQEAEIVKTTDWLKNRNGF